MLAVSFFAVGAAAWSAPSPATGEARADSHGDPLPPGVLARLGTERLRHGDAVSAVAFTPDGKFLVSAGWDWLVRLWDPATGKEVRRLKGLPGPVRVMALSPDGAFVAAVGGVEQPSVRLWRTANGAAQPWPVKHQGWVQALAFSPDSKTLATAEQDRKIRLWDVATGGLVRQLDGRQMAVLSLAFSPDGDVLLSGSKDGSACLHKVASGAVLRSVRIQTRVSSVTFSPDGKTWASAGGDGTVRLYDRASGAVVRRFEGQEPFVVSIAFAPDGRTLASAGHNFVRLWDVAGRREPRLLTGRFEGVGAVAFSPDGKTLAAGGRESRIRLWDVATGRELHRAEGHKGIVWALAFSPDGKTLASGGSDHIIRLWDVASHKLLRRLEGHTGHVVALAFSPDGDTLASGGPDRTVRLWQTSTGKEVGRFLGEHPAGFAGLSFSGDGKWLAAAGSDQAVWLWDVTTGRTVRVFRCPGSSPLHVLLSPGGGTLMAACHGKDIYTWPVGSGVVRYHIQSNGSFHLCGALSADGHNVAGQRVDGRVCVWEAATGEERVGFPQEEQTWSLAFAPDGERLICSLASGPLCVWDLHAAREVARLPGHSCLARALACSPDGKTLASGGSDGTVLLWDLARLPGPKLPPPRQLSPAELEAEWQALGGEDAARAYRALWTLRSVPQQTLPLLRRDLRPATAAEMERISRLVKDLNSDDFAVRQRATAELEKVGDLVEGALQKALEASPSVDLRRRAERLLEKCRTGRPAVNRLRQLRMLELLEKIGSREADRRLRTLADNETDTWLAGEAKDARVRLRTHAGPRP